MRNPQRTKAAAILAVSGFGLLALARPAQSPVRTRAQNPLQWRAAAAAIGCGPENPHGQYVVEAPQPAGHEGVLDAARRSAAVVVGTLANTALAHAPGSLYFSAAALRVDRVLRNTGGIDSLSPGASISLLDFGGADLDGANCVTAAGAGLYIQPGRQYVVMIWLAPRFLEPRTPPLPNSLIGRHWFELQPDGSALAMEEGSLYADPLTASFARLQAAIAALPLSPIAEPTSADGAIHHPER